MGVLVGCVTGAATPLPLVYVHGPFTHVSQISKQSSTPSRSSDSIDILNLSSVMHTQGKLVNNICKYIDIKQHNIIIHQHHHKNP
jgi:hypothetical protein